jgi:3D (Asp-Asp-Asp) domain-containing protein
VIVSWSVQVDSGYTGDVSEQASFGCTQLAATVASDDPSTPAAADPTVVNLAAALQIPTLQTAGLATLIVLLLLAGWFLVEDKRRRLLLMLVLGLSLGALGVRAAVLAPVQAGAVSTAKAATTKTHKTRSGEAVEKARQARLARRSLHAATVLQVAAHDGAVRLAFSDGTTLTAPRARVHMLPIKLDKAAKRGLTRNQKRAMQRQRAAAKRIENLQPGQAVMVGVRYAADGSVQSVHIRPEADLAAAQAEVARVEAKRADRAQRSAGHSR